MKYNEGDLVICTVKDIVKTTVFVETEEGVKGSLVFSEIAPGRIRNIRDYVVPNKVVVCKILSISDNHLFLSLRRVKDKDKKELIEVFKREKSLEGVVKKILGEKAHETIKKIKQNEGLNVVFSENSGLLEKYFSKQEIEKLNKIVWEKAKKEVEIKKEFFLNSRQPDGILKIKRLLSEHENIYYLGGSKFIIKIKSKDPKHTDTEINKIIENIEKNSKKEKCDFLIKK